MCRKSLLLPLLLLLASLSLTGCLSGDSQTSTGAPVNAERPPWQDIYTDVTFSGPGFGLISGWHGTILKSTDTGQKWSPMKVDSRADLNSIAIFDQNTAVAVGSGGNILRSTDGGQTWSPVESPTTETLNRVRSSAGGNAIAVGWRGTILRTRDSGKTWTQEAGSLDPSLTFEDVSVIQGGFGIVVSSSGRVFRTEDLTGWQELTLPGQGNKLFAVDVLDSTFAYVAGNLDLENSYNYGTKSVVLKTGDGGNDWKFGPGGMNADLLALKFVDYSTTLAVGWNGDVWRTGDAGDSWQPMVSHTTQALRAVAMADATTACAVGDGQTVITSRNSGITWEKLSGP